MNQLKKDLLFEIGTEDIPPPYLPKIGSELEDSASAELEDNNIEFGKVKLYYTPRRLALIVKDVSENQSTKNKTIKGPPAHVAIDEDEEYTEAALGFARNEDADPGDLYRKETDQGEYLFLDKKVGGKKSSKLLRKLLPALVRNLHQPEKMKWDGSGIEFIRPIRWLVCLFGEEILDLKIANLTAGNKSRGHRFLSPDPIELQKPSEYVRKLKKNHVVAKPEERKNMVLNQAKDSADEINAELKTDKDFLTILANSLEYPTPVRGRFPEKFLDLPPVLLYKTLRKQARLIPLRSEEGSPKPYFIGFRDGKEDSTGEVKKGYESVIKSRLRDTQFFFENDRSKPLAEYTSQLKKVTFLKDLGTIWDKVSRIRRLANTLHKETGLGKEETVDRTAFLCKADLVTEIVDEYPDLQGKIGSIYAELDGEEKEVVEGIKEQYKPENAEDSPPKTNTGTLISIADKLDTLLGSFFLGEEPTGSKDPHGLRRKARAVIRTIIEGKLDLDLFEILDEGAELFESLNDKSSRDRLKEFFGKRLEAALKKNYGLPYDVVSAVTKHRKTNAFDVYRRAKALGEFKGTEELTGLLAPFERIKNITDGGSEEFDPDLFRKDEERKLWQEYIKKNNKINKAIETADYSKAIKHLTELKDPIDDYFENVLIMADEEKIKENRISFLLNLEKTFERIGDLTEIVEEE